MKGVWLYAFILVVVAHTAQAADQSKEMTENHLGSVVHVPHKLKNDQPLVPTHYSASKIDHFFSRVANETDACPSGYAGISCDECARNHYRLGQKCESCDASNSFSAILIVICVLSGLFFVLAIIMFKYVKKYIIESVAVDIAINFAQMLGTLNAMDNVLTGDTKSIVNIAGFSNINLQLSRPECYSDTASYQTIWFARMALPFALFLPAFIISWIIRMIDRMVEDKNIISNEFLGMIYRQIMVFLYVSVSTTTLELFDCSHDHGKYSLDASPDIICLKGEWLQMLPAAIFGLLLYVIGIPAAVYFIYKKYDLLRPKQYGDSTTEHFYNWELVILIRKLLLIVFALYLNKHPVAFFICATLLMSASLFSHLRYNPFVKKRHNILDACMLFTLLFFVISTLVISQDSSTSTEKGIFWTEMTLIMINIIMFIYVWAIDMIDAYNQKDEDEVIKNEMEEEENGIEMDQQNSVIVPDLSSFSNENQAGSASGGFHSPSPQHINNLNKPDIVHESPIQVPMRALKTVEQDPTYDNNPNHINIPNTPDFPMHVAEDQNKSIPVGNQYRDLSGIEYQPIQISSPPRHVDEIPAPHPLTQEGMLPKQSDSHLIQGDRNNSDTDKVQQSPNSDKHKEAIYLRDANIMGSVAESPQTLEGPTNEPTLPYSNPYNQDANESEHDEHSYPSEPQFTTDTRGQFEGHPQPTDTLDSYSLNAPIESPPTLDEPTNEPSLPYSNPYKQDANESEHDEHSYPSEPQYTSPYMQGQQTYPNNIYPPAPPIIPSQPVFQPMQSPPHLPPFTSHNTEHTQPATYGDNYQQSNSYPSHQSPASPSGYPYNPPVQNIYPVPQEYPPPQTVPTGYQVPSTPYPHVPPYPPQPNVYPLPNPPDPTYVHPAQQPANPQYAPNPALFQPPPNPYYPQPNLTNVYPHVPGQLPYYDRGPGFS